MSVSKSGRSTLTLERPRKKLAHVWRRLHGGQAIAQVHRLDGMGQWLVSAFSTRNDGRSVRIARAFSMLTDAQDAADGLVGESFEHTCRTGECGRWLRWPEPGDEPLAE